MAVHVVQSPADLQSKLNEDLERVTLLNFRADWAEPCQAMDQVALHLSQHYPASKLLVLSIDAEEQEDISESFQVDAVPYTILLRGHQLLERLSGAQAELLNQKVKLHINSKARPAVPLSKTTQAPEAPPKAAYHADAKETAQTTASNDTAHGPMPIAEDEEEPEADLTARCQELMTAAPVMLFMKGDPTMPRCGFSQKTVALLRKENVDFDSFDILQDESVRQHLKKLNQWPTFPQLIVKGDFVGGLDILTEMIDTGELKELLAAA
ncbi:uncharacterized protein L969DRAFT_19554 [Mixia osmundae IAM 14324]|uniref:Uncharacterized protein n=1 Tax=Mixia osmundae (strain CBS 9802 / IAM 14324 / JCM 22182 / KY 12970) TaxID=764103 RepID=G7EAV6_MIXOS|nr:uncharacterized protein L969DRAFT_19554 [Mixia osmundae IAM 14324]KEI37000.1 hypothetical protein L969DRAFT_19554 [Mixia osmundae IAM 14324]GAA99966.1 hypothetical protein E5Q_06669 [Mixia osmundae IAM 14324]